MTDTVTEFVAAADQADPSPGTASVEQKLIAQLVDQARSKGLQPTGEGGLLQQLTARVLESALEGEITDHLGYDKHEPAGKDRGNSRNGTRSKHARSCAAGTARWSVGGEPACFEEDIDLACMSSPPMRGCFAADVVVPDSRRDQSRISL